MREIIARFDDENETAFVYGEEVGELIRCKDCIYFTEYCRIVDGVTSNHVCSRKREIDGTMHRVKADDYCSWAKSKEK